MSKNTSNIKKEEEKWRAEADAYTLAEYAKIATDPKRMAAAIAEAKRKAKDLRDQADAIEVVNENLENKSKKKK